MERRLRERYGRPRHHNPVDPLDDLIFVVISRMTQELKYLRTYDALRHRYRTWDEVRESPEGELEALLRDAGLAATKSRHIRQLLAEVHVREGRHDLSRLRSLDDDAIERYLTSLPGVSVKTARCVMLYALGRQTLPADAHVWRICRRLGVAPDRPWTGRLGAELQDRVPAALRGSLHVTLLAHGREVCLARAPRCDGCILRDLCPHAPAAE